MSESSIYSFKPLLTYYIFREKIPFFKFPVDIRKEWIIFAPVEGQFSYTIGEESGVAQFGDLVVCPPDTLFQRTVIEPLAFHHMKIHWKDERGLHAAPQMMPSGKLTITNVNVLADIYERLRATSTSMQWATHKIQKLGHHVQDIWYLYFEETGIAANSSREPHQPLMLQIRDLIREQALGNISLQHIAAQHRYSSSQLSKHFKAAFNMSPIDYVTSIRLEEARRLLLETDQSLEAIALQCGYPNGYYLNRVFRKQFNSTPGTYRKNYQV